MVSAAPPPVPVVPVRAAPRRPEPVARRPAPEFNIVRLIVP